MIHRYFVVLWTWEEKEEQEERRRRRMDEEKQRRREEIDLLRKPVTLRCGITLKNALCKAAMVTLCCSIRFVNELISLLLHRHRLIVILIASSSSIFAQHQHHGDVVLVFWCCFSQILVSSHHYAHVHVDHRRRLSQTRPPICQTRSTSLCTRGGQREGWVPSSPET